ncbi:MAG: anti-sigma factor family protein [Planctomycetota bacterium]
MDCSKANELMVEFVEGTLAEDAHREVTDHIENCADCMTELEKVSSTSRILRALGHEVVRAPDDLDLEITRSIRNTGTWYFVKRYGIPAGIFAAVIALVLLAIAFGFALFG